MGREDDFGRQLLERVYECVLKSVRSSTTETHIVNKHTSSVQALTPFLCTHVYLCACALALVSFCMCGCSSVVECVEVSCFFSRVAYVSGQHVAAFAKHFPDCEFLPTDLEPECLASISAYVSEAGSQTIFINTHT